MSESAELRQTLIDIDRQLLALLPPHGAQDHVALEAVAALERARTATEQSLLDAEVDEAKGVA